MSPDWLHGRNVVREALLSGTPMTRIQIADGAHGAPIEEILRLARDRAVPVQRTDRAALDRRAPNNQGVLAEVKTLRALTVAELLEELGPPSETDRILVLDSVQDPGNVGALIRTASAVGVRGVVLPEHRAAGVTPTVVKASAGAALHVPIARAPNLRQSLQALKQAGFWIVGLNAHRGEPFDQANLRGPLAVVVGAEGRGLGELIRRECDLLVQLPISDAVESLNASVAGSILLYHLYRQDSR